MIFALMLFALLASGDAWRDFSDWFSTRGTPGAPADVMAAYSAHLKTRGVPESEVESTIKAVQEHLAAHPREALTLHFNRVYTWTEAPFSREPSAVLIKVASSRKPGKALDIAMGQGRNAIWLAKAGWEVSGYDISDEALRQAAAGAAAAGVKLDTQIASHLEYELGHEKWDLIVMSFAFTPLNDPAYMKRVRDSLKTGGVLFVEGFGGGPTPEPNSVLKGCLEYRVLLFEDLPGFSDWGQHKAPLLRLALEK